MSAATPIANDQDQARELLRREHNVRIVRGEEEGLAFHKLPGGVYGFTYAPATETPLFGHKSYHSFEVHKLPDGSGRLIGYCAPEDTARIQSIGQQVDLTLYPDPWESATNLMSIDLGWLVSDNYRPVRKEGNGLLLRLWREAGEVVRHPEHPGSTSATTSPALTS
jgi:hypothetical protein